MGTLLQARRNLGATAQRKSAPAPLPPLTNDEIAPPKKQRPRAGKSGRTEPRYATAMTAEPAAPMPSFLTGANADQPGVRREKRERKEVHGRESKHGCVCLAFVLALTHRQAHRPAVMSSKRAVPRARQVVEVPRVVRSGSTLHSATLKSGTGKKRSPLRLALRRFRPLSLQQIVRLPR